jgi:GNAT superfamily N-acetyltransferase
MESAELLDLYDREQRREVMFFGFRRETTPHVVRQVSQLGDRSSIAYSHLSGDDVEAVVEREIEYFSDIGHDFEWKVFGHDTPVDLGTRLINRGFEPEEEEALLVLDMAATPIVQKAIPGIDMRRLSTPDALADVRVVEEAVWGEDFSRLIDELSLTLLQAPATLSVYVVYADNQPVSSAWIRFHQGSQFASLWGGSTLPAYRGRGLYRALIETRAAEALARNVRFLTVDASPMSRPILERNGFGLIGFSRPYVWRKERDREASRDM